MKIIFLTLVTIKLATFAVLASKHGRQLINEIFIYSKDIASSPGYLKAWGIFKVTTVALGSLDDFKNSYSRHFRIVNTVVSLIAD